MQLFDSSPKSYAVSMPLHKPGLHSADIPKLQLQEMLREAQIFADCCGLDGF